MRVLAILNSASSFRKCAISNCLLAALSTTLRAVASDVHLLGLAGIAHSPLCAMYGAFQQALGVQRCLYRTTVMLPMFAVTKRKISNRPACNVFKILVEEYEGRSSSKTHEAAGAPSLMESGEDLAIHMFEFGCRQHSTQKHVCEAGLSVVAGRAD